MSDQILLTTKPSFLREYAVAIVLGVISFIVGIVGTVMDTDTGTIVLSIGFISFFVIICMIASGWWRCLATTLTITDDRTMLRIGILSKATTEVRHKDVRNTVITQSIGQRIFGIGRVDIASAGHGGIEISVSGIPNPEHIRKLIDEHRD